MMQKPVKTPIKKNLKVPTKKAVLNMNISIMSARDPNQSMFSNLSVDSAGSRSARLQQRRENVEDEDIKD